MPGFWETMKRLVAGEPVYQAGDDQQQPKAKDEPRPEASAAERTTPVETNNPLPPAPPVPTWQQVPPVGQKIYPEVVIERVECHAEDYDMELTVHIQNNSLERVVLDRIIILDRTDELGDDINPGDKLELAAYSGPMPKDTNASRCELRYRNEAGDYFAAIHHVEFEQEVDGRYSIRRIRFIPPVKDV